jgi:hypothetical protein
VHLVEGITDEEIRGGRHGDHDADHEGTGDK